MRECFLIPTGSEMSYSPLRLDTSTCHKLVIPMQTEIQRQAVSGSCNQDPNHAEFLLKVRRNDDAQDKLAGCTCPMN